MYHFNGFLKRMTGLTLYDFDVLTPSNISEHDRAMGMKDRKETYIEVDTFFLNWVREYNPEEKEIENARDEILERFVDVIA